MADKKELKPEEINQIDGGTSLFDNIHDKLKQNNHEMEKVGENLDGVNQSLKKVDHTLNSLGKIDF